MHESVFFNSGLVPKFAPHLPALSAASLFGKGIFTTIAIYAGAPFVWEKHWRRLEQNCATLGIDLADFNERATRKALDELIGANSIRDGRARITFFDGTASDLWPFESDRGTSLLIMTADLHRPVEHFSLALSPHRKSSTSPLAGVKSCNYLENILAKDEAKRRSFGEAIQLNERDEVTSACMANIFWLNGEDLLTPSIKTGCLAGTTREFVLENLACREVEVGIEELRSADEIFLTSAGLGVVQVARFEDRNLKGEDHAILHLLRY